MAALVLQLCFSPQAWPQSGVLRVANTTLRLPLELPKVGYQLTNILGDLAFQDPVCIKSPPGETNRLFVVERTGRIIVITNLAAPSKTVFLDLSTDTYSDYIEAGLLGLAFHPGYATNRCFYVFRTAITTTTGSTNLLHDVLSRFEASPTDPNVASSASELRLIAQYDDSVEHNAGEVEFGPDGYLYISLGDGSPPPRDRSSDPQAIDKGFFGGIIRIDPDQRPGSLLPNPHPSSTTNYGIPPDNPFIGVTSHNGNSVDPNQVRTEFYAVGFRNPWRMAFDSVTGDLYCGDVGGANWEEINVVERGGNYGWPYREGFAGGSPPETNDILPLYAYGHGYGGTQGIDVIGGVVHHGGVLTELSGSYLFGDYSSGNIWALRHSGTNVTSVQRLIADVGVSAFGIDPRDGEILLANYDRGTVQKLVYVPPGAEPELPPSLSATGIFSDLSTLNPESGILPYEVNVSFWSDNAQKRRWFSVPDPSARIGFQYELPWTFPPGSVWIKHFGLELTNGVPESERRVETRVLVKSANGVYGVTYRWNDEQTDATLVSDDGLDETFVIKDGGIERTQAWHYPSRQECLFCHTERSGFALGFGSAQLDCDILTGSNRVNQIQLLSDSGYLDLEPDVARIRPLAAATNSGYPVGYRVRSYLAANCSQCHQGSQNIPTLGGAGWDARFQTPTPDAGIVDGPAFGNFGDPSNRVISPLAPEHSVMLQRVNLRGPFQMPPLATRVIDSNDVALLTEWITTFPPAPWRSADIGAVLQEGFDSVSNGVFQLSGSGEGIAKTADGFHFLYQPLAGDLQLVARTAGPQGNYGSAQFGPMLRAGLDADAPFVMLEENVSGQIIFTFRRNAGEETEHGVSAGWQGFNGWMKLARAGDLVSGYTSTDGINWQLLDSVTIGLGTNVAAGLAVTSGQNPALQAVNYEKVSLLSLTISVASSQLFRAPASIPLQVQLAGDSDRVSKIEFFANGEVIGEATSAPYVLDWSHVGVGHYSVTAVTTDNQGITFVSAPVVVDVTAPVSNVAFLGADTVTGGSWPGVYGTEGAWIFGSANFLPPYAAPAIQGANTYTWSDNTTETRALETQDESDRIAATVYADDEFTIDLAFNDGQLHQLVLYFLDWDGSNQRSETIEIWNDTTRTLLDSRVVSSFSNGTYLRWDIRGQVLIRIVRNGFGNAVLSGIFLDPPGDVPPSVRLASPIDGSQFTLPTAIPIEADASDSDSPIAFVELFINGQLIRHLTNAPYGFAWSNALQGSYTLTARAVDNLGESQTSDPVMITATLPKAAAEFVGTDSTTHGDWIGRYGFNGFAIPSYVTNYPSFASVSVTNAQVFIWQNPSDDGGALQYTNTAGRIASCWFDGETVGVVVDLLDGLDHKVSLYFLDLEGVRNLGIDVIDPADGSLLDTRSINDAGQGLYYSWIVQGRVGFQITRLTANAVLSGVFLDPLIVSSRAPRLSARQNNQSEPPGVQFELRGVPNYPYRIESSTNLADWSLWQVQVASPSGRITFLETLDTDSSERFYRAILLH